jgi:HK97 family phage portal protein
VGLFGRKREKRTESLAEFDARLDVLASGGSGLPGGLFFSDIMAMNLAAVFNAATIRTQYLAMVPLVTYYTDGQNKDKYKGSPIYSLLHDKPNPLMTSYSWRSTMELHAIFYGGGFSRIERDVLGRPIWLWLLDAKRIKPELRDNGRELVWKYRQLKGGEIEYPDTDILHIPGLAFDGITGEGVIKLAAASFSLAAQAESFGETFFSQGMNAGGVFQSPNALSDQAFGHLKESLKTENSGSRNAHKPIILEEGMTWNKITFSPEEAQFMATREFQDKEIARWFNLPLRMLKMADASGLRNVEQIAIEMMQGTMLPRYVAWEQELNTKLFAAPSGNMGSRFAEFNVDGLLRGDSKTRADVSHIMRLDGALNANEWRARENMNPIEGEKGNEYWGQPNLAANKSNTEEKPKEDKPEDNPDDEPAPEDEPVEGEK